MLRLAHPFPSLLNSVATLSIALLAGGAADVAIRLAGSMLAIQAAIGALNDLSDRGRDAVAKPGKPLPSGSAAPAAAMALAAGGAVVGIVLSAPSGLPVAVVAAAGLLLGWVYDLWLSRTRWSWLPLALALPLLPIHAWLGATGTVPPSLLTLVPAAVLAGAALALSNGLVDLERDTVASRGAVVVALGQGRAWLIHLALLAAVATLAVSMAPVVPSAPFGSPGDGGDPGSTPLALLRTIRDLAIPIGVAVAAAGALVVRSAGAGRRERGWELEAIGVAAIGVGWLAGTAGAAATAGAAVTGA